MTEVYIPLKEARELLGVSRTKIWNLVKDGTLKKYEDPLDKRKTLVLRADVEKLKRPRASG